MKFDRFSVLSNLSLKSELSADTNTIENVFNTNKTNLTLNHKQNTVLCAVRLTEHFAMLLFSIANTFFYGEINARCNSKK